MELFSYVGLHTAYLLVFSISLGLGIGSSALSYVLYLFAERDEKISRDEYKLFKMSRVVIWSSLFLYSLSGIGLFTLAYESMLGLGIFYASMTVAAILITNELVFSFHHLPRIYKNRGNVSLDAFVLESGAIAAVSWIFLMIHHVIYRTDIGYFAFMGLYTGSLTFVVLLTWFIHRSMLSGRDAKILMRSTMASIVLAAVFAGAWYMNADEYFRTKEVTKQLADTVATAVSGAAYTMDDVALHNSPEDCWLAIDGKVFNVTETARLHPAMFNCGKDVSENYHKNHGQGIRDKMMKFYIGDTRTGTGVTNVDFPFAKNETLKPFRELYAKEGSWNTRELMMVVEKDAENVLAINGTTHEAVGRINKVGFQPHTSVFSSNGKWMYIISRDGWLTKIDLSTLQPALSVNVGKNSRGTAITDNGKYIAVGNYDPGNLVILDADTLKILKTIPLTEKTNGVDTTSRAGAVVESSNRIVVALKDSTSVWVVDTDQKNFPISEKFSGIGGNVPALHDAFLTPDGKYYIVASQGSKTAWVLDLATMKPIVEVQTGETPHTGPGASWGNNIYIPALGEGLITVVDTQKWKPIKYIKTGGPGLFIRHYSRDPNYPYIWADTAFGDHKDEIYVIDGRSNEIVKTLIPLKGEDSWHPEFTFDGKFVYVVSKSGNEVIVYDSHSFGVAKRIPADTPSAVSNVGLRIEEPGL